MKLILILAGLVLVGGGAVALQGRDVHKTIHETHEVRIQPGVLDRINKALE